MTSISDHEARRLARLYAADVCVCGHTRGAHQDRSGAARRCQEPRTSCPCKNYAHAPEVAKA